ncbi:hypothetical protein FQR65_LT16685 [Abscondita terminalis]|nr:hypothetical protein FQR65_LT16685 [Abscondita terminalis]
MDPYEIEIATLQKLYEEVPMPTDIDQASDDDSDADPNFCELLQHETDSEQEDVEDVDLPTEKPQICKSQIKLRTWIYQDLCTLTSSHTPSWLLIVRLYLRTFLSEGKKYIGPIISDKQSTHNLLSSEQHMVSCKWNPLTTVTAGQASSEPIPTSRRAPLRLLCVRFWHLVIVVYTPIKSLKAY